MRDDKYCSINCSHLYAKDIMGINPKTISANELAAASLDVMRNNNISQLIVLENGLYAGVLHLHDLVREGII